MKILLVIAIYLLTLQNSHAELTKDDLYNFYLAVLNAFTADEHQSHENIKVLANSMSDELFKILNNLPKEQTISMLTTGIEYFPVIFGKNDNGKKIIKERTNAALEDSLKKI